MSPSSVCSGAHNFDAALVTSQSKLSWLLQKIFQLQHIIPSPLLPNVIFYPFKNPLPWSLWHLLVEGLHQNNYLHLWVPHARCAISSLLGGIPMMTSFYSFPWKISIFSKVLTAIRNLKTFCYIFVAYFWLLTYRTQNNYFLFQTEIFSLENNR